MDLLIGYCLRWIYLFDIVSDGFTCWILFKTDPFDIVSDGHITCAKTNTKPFAEKYNMDKI